jgi:hypothetical protein
MILGDPFDRLGDGGGAEIVAGWMGDLGRHV